MSTEARPSRSFLTWALTAFVIALLEYPFGRAFTRLIGPVLQPYPSRELHSHGHGDTFVDLAIPTAAVTYFLLWIVAFGVLGLFIRREALAAVWGRTCLLFFVVVIHLLLHYGSPWLLVVTDCTGLTKTASLTPPPYLNVLQPPQSRFFEVPSVVLLLFLLGSIKPRRSQPSRSQAENRA